MIPTERAVIDLGICETEPRSFELIVIEHQKRIYRILFALVRDADAADTLTQECFLKAHRKYRSFRGDSSAATWLTRIAINLARDHNSSRRRAFWQSLLRTDRIEDIPTVDIQRSPEQALIDSESANEVMTAVEHLPEKQKTVFLLRFVEEMPLEAIAEAMDLKIGTVKTHLFRSLEAVRRECGKQDNKTYRVGITNDTRKTFPEIF
jgi:RNA polymerase sigma-70 factor (ECF subfamily)